MYSLTLTIRRLGELACISLTPFDLHPTRWEEAVSIYVLPLAVAAAAITFIVWRQHAKDINKLTHDLEQARSLAQERERERDLAPGRTFSPPLRRT